MSIKEVYVVVIDVLLTFLWRIATFNLLGQLYSLNILIFVTMYWIYNNMERKLLNRIKVVLAEKNKSNKWLSEQLDKDPAIISKWVTNTTQPNVEMLIQIAKVLDVSVDDLLRTE